MLLFNTQLPPKDIAARGLDWWYVVLRNGHVSIHSERSLRRLAADHSLSLLSLSSGTHICVARDARRLQEPMAQVLRGWAWNILRHAARCGLGFYGRATAALVRRNILAPALQPSMPLSR